MFSDIRWRLIEATGKLKIFAIVALAFLLLIFYWLSNWPTGEPQYFSGVVISVGPINVSSLAGGIAQGATVRLSDGRTVTVTLSRHVTLLKQDDIVQVIQQDSLFGSPGFGITGNP